MVIKKKEKYKIYLFRHGKTDFNEKGIFTGWKDSHLTRNGLKNARDVALKLKNKKIDLAFQTKLSRSKDTLKEVLKYHPECKKILTDNRMIERSYGTLEGMKHSDFVDKIGNKLFKLEVEGDALENLSDSDKKRIKKFLGETEYNLIHRGYNTPPPRGESFSMVEKRVERFIRYLKRLIRRKKVNVAISAHGNSIRLFRKIIEKASVSEMVEWNIPYDRVYTYSIEV